MERRRAPAPTLEPEARASPEARSVEQSGSPELTLRAVFVGCAIGALLAAANVYTGLKTAFIDGGNVTASVLGFALFASLRGTRRAYSVLENNLTQTIAASAALMSMVTGVAGPIPALALAGLASPPLAVGAFGVALGVLGVLIALLLRDQLIRVEGLPFPTGSATAEVIAAMATHAGAAARRARALLAAALLAALWTVLRDGPSARVPSELLLPGALLGIPLASLSVGVSLSPLLFSTGVLVGARVGLSMLCGSLLARLVLAPWLVDAGHVAAADHGALMQWLMWPGTALVLSSALTGIAREWRALGRGLRDLTGLAGGLRHGGAHRALASGVAALSLLALGAAAAVVAIAHDTFGLSPVTSVLALALSLLLATVCARSAGETDIAPVGDMGGATQVVFGAQSPVASLACGAIVAGEASQTAATLWALKAGDKLGANVRNQILGQLVGVLVGALVVIPTYALVTRVYVVGSAQLPAPAALSWKATADAVQGGLEALPLHAPAAAIAGLAVGVGLTLLARHRVSRFLPSPVALGMGFLLPVSLSATMFLGGVALWLAARRARAISEELGASIAGGGIAGESLMAVVLAALLASGVL